LTYPLLATLFYSLGIGGLIWSIFSFIADIFQDMIMKNLVCKIEISNQDMLFAPVFKYI